MELLQHTGRRAAVVVGMVLGILLAGSTALSAQTIRMGSLAPEDSPWGRALNQVADEWDEISNGRITLRIYHGGVAGDESDVLRKLRINQLQAGVLTSSGMNTLTRKMLTLSMPLLINNEDEFRYVFENIRPELEESLREEGLHVVGWTFGGWVHFFSREAIYTPADLKDTRLAVTATEPEMQRAFQLMDYTAVPATSNEILPGLNSGMIDSFFNSPLAAASFQYFAIADNMLEIPMAPFLGAVVISDRVWRRFPPRLQEELEDSARSAIKEMESEVRELETEAIETMKSHGLTVISPNPEQEALWEEEFTQAYDLTVGRVFDQDMYNTIQELLHEYRNQ